MLYTDTKKKTKKTKQKKTYIIRSKVNIFDQIDFFLWL
ncbi:hypothetical protein FWK35_00036397 [Aphis craccivora]|uniref:Uncharacterized protein n=1 Tax=Aphis craccivora TaxID=307492 RepID=A0A6G0VWK2_APHCR|nr:hypothetical protein FWK35_00036397 [Aphis craccivora]